MPVFIEFRAFSRRRAELLEDEEYRALQNAILKSETRIDLIPVTNGLLKARWGGQGKGKRGGIRVIYYHVIDSDRYLMLLIYPKSEKDDLTPDQKKVLRDLVEKELIKGI